MTLNTVSLCSVTTARESKALLLGNLLGGVCVYICIEDRACVHVCGPCVCTLCACRALTCQSTQPLEAFVPVASFYLPRACEIGTVMISFYQGEKISKVTFFAKQIVPGLTCWGTVRLEFKSHPQFHCSRCVPCVHSGYLWVTVCSR